MGWDLSDTGVTLMPMDPVDLLIACVTKLGAEDVEVTGPSHVNFTLWSIESLAYVQDGGRLRGSVFIDLDIPKEDMPEAVEWAAHQEVGGGKVEAAWVATDEDDGGCIRVVFERDLDPELIQADDPLGQDAYNLLLSWGGEAPDLDLVPPAALRASDPTRIAPTNAWLLIGSESSYPDPHDLMIDRANAAKGLYEGFWTAAKQTEPGDLLFFYFRGDRKAIHFVARAADNAYFDDLGSGAEWSRRQWWAHVTPMVEIEPIALGELRQITGPTVMQGRSGRYLRPEHAARLSELARPIGPDDAALLARILRPVVGRADHPNPATLDLAAWRALASGTFEREADVERLVVEPLLRLSLHGAEDVSVVKAYPAGRRIVDYVVLRRGVPACAIEVKLRVRRSRRGVWAECRDFEQACDYARRLSVPAILIDALQVHLIHEGASEPTKTLNRAVLLEADLQTIRRHALGL